LPEPLVDRGLINTADADAMQQERHMDLMAHLELAMDPQCGNGAVIDFAVELLKALGYARRDQLVRRRVDLPLLICGEDRHAKAGVCIANHSQNDVLLLVQAEKRLEHGEPINARAQLVAEAVAAFNKINMEREAIGQPPLVEKVSHL
jgi:hypothetical protein